MSLSVNSGKKHSWLLHLAPINFWSNKEYYKTLLIIQISILAVCLSMIVYSYQVGVTHEYSVFNGFAGVSLLYALLSVLILTPFLSLFSVLYPRSFSQISKSPLEGVQIDFKVFIIHG